MPCENSARKRSKTMAFRCTPEEYELIANMAAWSGMSRQDYIMARLTGTEVTVRPSSRTQRALRDSMKGLAERLLVVCDADELDEGLQRQLALVMEIFNGFGEAPPPGRRAKREKGPSDDLFGMSRCLSRAAIGRRNRFRAHARVPARRGTAGAMRGQPRQSEAI